MLGFDPSLLDAFKTAETRIEDLDSGGRCIRTINVSKGTNLYRLRNRHVVPSRRAVLSAHARGHAGDLSPRYTLDHFGTELEVLDVGRPCYCLLAPLSGALEHTGPSGTVEAHGSKGMILRCSPGTRLVTSDASVRLVVWMDAARLERALQARLGEPPRGILAFAPGLDWSRGQDRVVWRMVVRLFEEARDPDGLLGEPLARETFTDLFLQTVLTRLPHNHTARLERPPGTAIPRHLRRAEAFMHAAADQPISMEEVAAAAGCATATLYAAFRRFRDTTPLAALHGIRLRRVREALQAAEDEVSTRSIARRFGFTNPSRFLAAYGKQFGEHPNETRRRRPFIVSSPWSDQDWDQARLACARRARYRPGMDKDVPRAHHDLGGVGKFMCEPVDTAPHGLTGFDRDVDALRQVLGRKRVMTVDELRRGIEAIPEAEYHRLSYYQRWVRSITDNLIRKGIITEAELAAALERTR